MAGKRKTNGRVSFNPVVAEKSVEGGLSEDDEVEEQPQEEEDEVMELVAGSADEIEDQDLPLLTTEEADTMVKTFKRMTTANETGFKKGDIILVRPEGVPKKVTDPKFLWKAKVIEVRRDKGGNVHLGVRWFYSAEQTAALSIPQKTRFRPMDTCGAHELIESTHEDVLSRDSFVSIFNVRELTDNPEAEEISENEWYTRALYSLKSKRFTKMSTHPCILCQGYYRPETGKSEDEQAYCPRCNKWFHHLCLDSKDRHVSQDESEEDLTKRLARNLPETTTQMTAKRARKDSVPQPIPSPSRKSSQQLELRAQSDLRRIAGTRIVRGGDFGIVGVVKSICTARTILAELEAGTITRLTNTDWRGRVGAHLIEASKDWPDTTEFCYTCPRCEKAI